jgi:2-keto-4-pentenoate hydratase
LSSGDVRVARGLATQLHEWRGRLARGERRIGWKIGLNVVAVQRQLGIDAPVIGHLTSASVIEDGSAHSLAGATRPGVEPEVAIHIAARVEAEEGWEAALAAVEGLGAAIEVVDIDPALRDVETILARNVFHRGAVLGSAGEASLPAGTSARVLRDGAPAAEELDVRAAVDVAGTVLHVAGLLESQGLRLDAGDVVIAGSLTPIVPVEPGSKVEVEIGTLGTLALSFVE